MKQLERGFEHILFSSRWILAPVYLGLVIALVVMLVKFSRQLWHLIITLPEANDASIIIGVLSLVDVSLIMNLMIIIILSGYENFVSKMDELHDHNDRPDWMGYIGFTDLKIKLIGSIVAISGVELLKDYMKIDEVSDHHLGWMVGIHLTFVLSGVLYAVMDKLNHHTGGKSGKSSEH